jgi:hypothetical protein
MRPTSVALFALALLAAGCGKSSSGPPSYDPDALARAAIAQLDKNGNGTIEGAELDACPSLRSALPAIDKNKDKALSADELTERFRAYKATGVTSASVSCTVRLNGQPLEGATVTFTPEEFLKGTIAGGSGTSDKTGALGFTTEGTNTPGLAFGLYRVSVSKKNAAGTETIPARYNTATTLGREVSPDPRGGGTIELSLTSP